MKKLLIVVGVLILVLVVAAIALPFLIDVNRFKPTLETDLSAALGRKVQIGNIQLALLSGGVTVDNLSIADDPAFSPSPFLQAKQLAAGVALMPLIFSKQLQVSSFTVTDPQINLLRDSSGKWNFSSLSSGASKSQSPSSSAATNFSVQKIKISNGTIASGRVGPGGKTHTYQNVNVDVSNVSYTSQFPFQLTATTPGNGTVKIDGKVGPIDPADASLTPLEANIDVENLDLASTGFVDPSSGLAGLIDFKGALASDGHQATSKGNVKADKIKLVANGSPSKVPVNVDYDTSYDLQRQTGNLTQGDVHIGKALAHLTGAFNDSGAETSVAMKLNGQGMPVADLEGVMPAVGITLPSGASLQSGGLEVNLTISGPADKLVIVGPVNLSNAKLAGFNLKSKLGALSSFTGLGGGTSGPDTDIQTLSANLHVDPQGTQAQNVLLIVPAIGTITGNANVSATQQLNCKMSAKLTTSGGVAGLATSALSSFTGGGGSGGSSKGLTIPFTVTGTTSNPKFVPDISGVAGGLVKNGAGTAGSAASAASSVLGGLFGKKKSQ
jgi:AsmA protein